MNLKSLCGSELVQKTEEAVRVEKLSAILVLKHLKEIESRKLYLKYNYPSLFEMAVKHFGYSAGGAYRRISSMRLLREVPIVAEKIESGGLTLATASQLQSFFRNNERYSKTQKAELIEQCINKSSRHVEKTLANLSPAAGKRDDIRYTDCDRLRLSLNISERLFEKLERLQYKYGCRTKEELIEKLADGIELPAKSILLPALEARTRHIPQVTKRMVLKKSLKKCAYINPETGVECEKTEKLEFDHIHPYSKGGPHLPENLRLMCSHHNKHVWQTEQKNN